jgi:RNA polymerase sigma-B factor
LASSHPLSAKVSRARLIESHLPLVRAIARRYDGRGEAPEDLVQVGAVGLIKAADRFDPSRGAAFATFATPAIEGEIRRHLRDRASSLRIPRALQQMSGELRRRRSELTAVLGRSPSLSELAAAIGADELDVERAISAERALESVRISSEDNVVELADAAETVTGSDDRVLLAESLRVLDDRERQIVLLRFHADMTEREIARAVGISQAHVSRLLGGALEKLRVELAAPQDGAGQGDITSAEVISAPSGDQSGQNLDKPTPRPTKIAVVGATQQKPTVAGYLELPYHVAVRSERDGDRSWWSATVDELPGCASRGSTPDEAVDQLRPAMESWLGAALAENREIPVPEGAALESRTAPSHKGRFLVRMPSSLHEQLARAAEREQVSLNRFVTAALAGSLAGTEPAEPSVAASPNASTRPRASKSDDAQIDFGPDSFRTASRALGVALATNLVVVVVAGVLALVLFVLALERGI